MFQCSNRIAVNPDRIFLPIRSRAKSSANPEVAFPLPLETYAKAPQDLSIIEYLCNF